MATIPATTELEDEYRRLGNYIAGRAGGTATDEDVARWENRRAAIALELAAPGELITKAYALTHRLHALEQIAKRAKASGARAVQRESETDTGQVRAQRDLITAELLRRMTPAPAADPTWEG